MSAAEGKLYSIVLLRQKGYYKTLSFHIMKSALFCDKHNSKKYTCFLMKNKEET
jgi:hypothetical protein